MPDSTRDEAARACVSACRGLIVGALFRRPFSSAHESSYDSPVSDAQPEFDSVPPRSEAPPSSELAPPSSIEEAPESAYYPPGPDGGLAPPAATTRYKLRVALVLAALLAFVAFYVGLLAAFGWLVVASITEIGWLRGRGVILNIALVITAAMLFLFLVKGLFHRRKFDDEHLVEITEETQPRLFAFLRRLASDAGATLPKKVYLSHDVNAAVMYPQSLLSLVWPVKKSLVLGLGLVNALDVAELKAVLAHEFGHFSQASMRLGRYVYVANGVVANLVLGRDKWDEALRGWQRMDLRISFPAWIIAGVVWCIRKILGVGWKGLNLAKLSLSRQMEFDADANAVRLAGSDAIVSGLWKSERAQLALGDALTGLRSVSEHGKLTRDVFYHQARSLRRIDELISKDAETRAHFEAILTRYRPGPALHFRAGGEQVSSLWESHPPHHEREAAAKSPYVASPPDTRPAWSLFRDPKGVRRSMTRTAYAAMGIEPAAPLAAKEVEALIEEERGEMRQAEHYHGLYENRVVSPGDLEAQVKDLDARAEGGELDVAALRAEAAAFAGDGLAALTKKFDDLGAQQRAVGMLKNGGKLRNKTLEFRGAPRTQKEILALEGAVDAEMEDVVAKLKNGDERLFRYHYACARVDLARQSELVLRYRFLVAVQQMLGSLSVYEGPIGSIVDLLNSGAELSAADVQALRRVATQTRDALEAALQRARTLPRPKLAHLAESRSLDDFLLPDELVEPLVSDAIAGRWLAELFGQHAGVSSRLRKLHFKNVGSLLALQESLDPALFPKEERRADDEDDGD